MGRGFGSASARPRGWGDGETWACARGSRAAGPVACGESTPPRAHVPRRRPRKERSPPAPRGVAWSSWGWREILNALEPLEPVKGALGEEVGLQRGQQLRLPSTLAAGSGQPGLEPAPAWLLRAQA